jgi:heme iron utilization protein
MSTDEKTATLKARFEQDQSGVLEDIAREAGLTTRAVMDCMPPECHAVADGAAFLDVMMDVADWGEITLLVHTADVILEYKGNLPPGRVAAGFFNLHGTALGGHLRLENCASIHFLRRLFMKLDTATIVFVNRDGEPMFKIFAGRNPDRSLKPDQLLRFASLRDRLRSGTCNGVAQGQ